MRNHELSEQFIIIACSLPQLNLGQRKIGVDEATGAAQTSRYVGLLSSHLCTVFPMTKLLIHPRFSARTCILNLMQTSTGHACKTKTQLKKMLRKTRLNGVVVTMFLQMQTCMGANYFVHLLPRPRCYHLYFVSQSIG